MCIACTCIFILYVHIVYEYVCVCCFVSMSVHECVSGHVDNCMGCVCTCVLAAEYSFSSTVFVAIVALCGKEEFWWHRVSAPKFPEVGAKCCMFHGSEFPKHIKSGLGPSLGEPMSCGPSAGSEGSISSLLPVPLAGEVHLLAVNWDPDTHSRSWLTASSLAFFLKRLPFRG